MSDETSEIEINNFNVKCYKIDKNKFKNEKPKEKSI